MKQILQTTGTALSMAVVSSFSTGAMAAENGFIEDTTATLQARNYYFSRDYSDIVGANQHRRLRNGPRASFSTSSPVTPRAPSALVWMSSACWGLKLDSSPDWVNTGLLPVQDDGRAADDYSRLEGALKMRYSQNRTGKSGELQPNLPVLVFSDIRLLPPSYQGASITSNEINGLTLQGGHLSSTSLAQRSG